MHALSILSILMVFFSSCSSCSSGTKDQQTETTKTEVVLEEYLDDYSVSEIELKGQDLSDIATTSKPVRSNRRSTEQSLEIKLATSKESMHPSVKSYQPKVITNSTSKPMPTFVPYKTTNIISSDVTEWRTKDLEIKDINVSLVGVNINTWLETPDYFTVLKETAKKFPIQILLDNLISNNPELNFNNPQTVKKALNEDIYYPYMSKLSNYKKTLQFADINEVVSYTRNHHIYGVAVGGLPYFGRPVEGGKERNINLGLLRGQMDEIAVKLPDTDVFLVAMINIIPNWLEESLDIHHIPQQQVEVLIYAFDRQGILVLA